MTHTVVILSGGLDSTTLLYEVVNEVGPKEVAALTFDYGQSHRIEIEQARKTTQRLGILHQIVPIPALNTLAPSALTREAISVPLGHYEADSMRETVVPNRNMVLLALGASYAISLNAERLSYGAHAGDHTIYPDCRPPFVDAMRRALAVCDWHPVTLDAPYLHLTKGDILRRGLSLGVDYALTWTCYQPGPIPCGKCGSCTERAEAFAENTTPDPLEKL